MISVLIEAIRYQENGYSAHFHLCISNIPFCGKETAVELFSTSTDPSGILLLCGVQSRRKRLLLCCK